MKRFFWKILLPIILSAMATAIGYARATSFLPVISNYSPLRYRAGLQNWSCTQDSEGTMFFGNNSGLLSFDGYNWTLHPMPGNELIRSVYADGKRIYVGSYSDFGYFERDECGRYKYESLWPKNYKSHSDEIWNIFKGYDGRIYFQSFCSWFDYDGRKATAHYNPSSRPLWFFKVNGKIFMQKVDGGFYTLHDATFIPLLEREDYGNSDIVSVVSIGHGRLLLVTSKSGIFIYDGKKSKPWNTSVDSELKAGLVNRGALYNGNTLVLGTIKNGIYAIDINGRRMLWHYNTESYLYNNTVLNLFIDRDNNIWAALDNGLSMIHSGIPLTVMRTGSIGMVYGLCTYKNGMYISTNQAVWHYDSHRSDITEVKNTEGQNWYMASADGQLLAGNNYGTKYIIGNNALNAAGPQNGSTNIKYIDYFGQKVLLEASYDGFKIYRNMNGKWTYNNEMKGFVMPIRDFEVDKSGIIWTAHMSRGFYKIKPSKNLMKADEVTYYESPVPGEKPGMVHIANIMGRVVFSYKNKLYTYDDINKKMVEYKELGNLVNNRLISSVYVDNDNFWTADHSGFTLITSTAKGLKVRTYLPNTIFGQECNTTGPSMYVDGNYTYFFLNDGIGRYDNRTRLRHASAYRLKISSACSYDSNNRRKDLPCDNESGKCPEIHDNLSLKLSYPNYNREKYIFQFVLESFGEKIISKSEIPETVYNNLGYGSYTLRISVTMPDGRVLDSMTYTFKNPHPIYLSIWAWLFYLVLLISGIHFYTRWRTSILLKRKSREMEKELITQKMKRLEQEQIISEQQKKLLENELTAKGKELASTAFDAVAMKNSVDGIKESLIDECQKGTISRKNLEKILHQVDTVDNGQFWNVFRSNFDLIHKKFFRNLKQQYPNLTYTDLKFCALLRLNLNTKDIAHFTNLTIRGVEGARYRLRKKMDIPANKSLTDFLIEFE